VLELQQEASLDFPVEAHRPREQSAWEDEAAVERFPDS
jgi:hypothetical protein